MQIATTISCCSLSVSMFLLSCIILLQVSLLFNHPVDKDALMDKEWLCPVSFQCDANQYQYRLIFHELDSPCKVNYPGMFGFFLSLIFSACHPASRCNLFHLHKDTYLYFLKITSVVNPTPPKEPPSNTPYTPRPPPPPYICTINYHCIGVSIETPVHKFKPGSRAALTQCGFSVCCATRDRRDWRESMFHKDT